MRPNKDIMPGRSTGGRPGTALVLALCVLLAGCGNNVMSLLQEESQLVWDAHQVAMAASDLEPGLEDAFYGAEMAKLDACRPIDEAWPMPSRRAV